MNTTATTASFNSATTEDKTIAIVSYLTLIGFIAAIVMHGSRKTRIGAYHLRQSLGLMLTSIAVAMAGTAFAFVPIIGLLAGLAAWGGIFALWIMALVSALNGEQKPVPVLGAHYQKWFAGAFD